MVDCNNEAAAAFVRSWEEGDEVGGAVPVGEDPTRVRFPKGTSLALRQAWWRGEISMTEIARQVGPADSVFM